MKHRFYKDDTGWYIDLPEYIAQGGEKADLEMVAGADYMLDELSGYGSEITIEMSENPIESYDGTLTKSGETEYGQDYVFQNEAYRHPVWLCPVTLYVFNGTYPDTIYIKL